MQHLSEKRCQTELINHILNGNMNALICKKAKQIQTGQNN